MPYYIKVHSFFLIIAGIITLLAIQTREKEEFKKLFENCSNAAKKYKEKSILKKESR